MGRDLKQGNPFKIVPNVEYKECTKNVLYLQRINQKRASNTNYKVFNRNVNNKPQSSARRWNISPN